MNDFFSQQRGIRPSRFVDHDHGKRRMTLEILKKCLRRRRSTDSQYEVGKQIFRHSIIAQNRVVTIDYRTSVVPAPSKLRECSSKNRRSRCTSKFADYRRQTNVRLRPADEHRTLRSTKATG